MGPKSKTNSVQPETHAELKKEWAQTLPLIYDEDSVLDRNEIEVWVRSFNSALKTADELDDYDLYMQHLFVLFCVLSLNVLKTNNVTGTSNAGKNATMSTSDLRHCHLYSFSLVNDYFRSQQGLQFSYAFAFS
jgi:hypothetical protein